MSHDKKTTSPSSAGGAAPAAAVSAPCPPDPPPIVKITFDPAVACPGHPLQLTATGSPGGGTYAWSLSGDGELVDAAGAPASTGNIVYLRCFKPDDATGNIPQRTATVKVTYTHPRGTATDSKNIPIHKIDFDVTGATVTAGVTKADERDEAQVVLGCVPGVATMSTDPVVKIRLDASCPRKAACAANHRLGFLQTVLTNERRIRYTHTEIQVIVALTIRDQIDGPAPFYNESYGDDATGLVAFTGDGDMQAVHHEDSPTQSAQWRDPRPHAPAPPPKKNRQLRQIFFSNGFRFWLVVQNIEWSAHDLANSFVYLRNCDWSMRLDTTVDMTKAKGHRCSPASNPPTIGAVGIGKGAGSPNIQPPYPNHDHTVTVAAAAGI